MLFWTNNSVVYTREQCFFTTAVGDHKHHPVLVEPPLVSVLEILISFEEMEHPGVVQGAEYRDFHSQLLQVVTALLRHLPRQW